MKSISWQAVNNAFKTEAAALLEAVKHIEIESFSKAVDVLKNAERIAASGCGHSGIACQHFTHLMCCVERPARFISPAEAIHGGMGFLQKGDVMLLASRGGKTAELIPIQNICKEKGVTIIAVTENISSPLAINADIVIKMHITHETDRNNIQGTTSFCVLSAIFDALQTALGEETEFKPDSFAKIHPGGAVGEKLTEGFR